MTGTPFNGRSSSLFNIEYHLNARIRQQYNWGGAVRYARKERGTKLFPEILSDSSKQRGRAESRWVDVMGVREQTIEERPTYDSQTGAYTGTTTYERPYTEAPGISPLLVAEVLDHAIFFSLGDLGKNLPDYEEIALPVEADEDVAVLYKDTLSQLKDYLIQRRWEGDSSFRGAYLQWAMGWPTSAHMPYEIIHNLKDRFSSQKRSFTVRHLPSLGTDRIYAKEQALIDLVRAELSNNRPCVIYVRQTQTRDLQPRLAELLKSHVPDAKPYILKNTVAAERREATIEQQIKAGSNIIICNPELVKTGLDLIAFPSLIYYEISFNLATMMQASARSYRLNQTHKLCKVYFLFYTETMEHHAVQLMSRKQRAAKLLNGEIGLTGLDALTEGEAGLEEELLRAIGREESLIDPNQLFKTDHVTTAIDAEDSLFWNVEAPAQDALSAEAVPLIKEAHDPLIAYALELGGRLDLEETIKPVPKLEAAKPHWRILPASDPRSAQLHGSIRAKLAEVSLLNAERLAKVQARVLNALECGVHNPSDQSLMLFEGLSHPDFAKRPVHAEAMIRWLMKYLRSEKVVSPDKVLQLASGLVELGKVIYTEETLPLKLASSLSKAPATPRKKLDLLAVPNDLPAPSASRKVANAALSPKRTQTKSEHPHQLALFTLPHVYA